MPAEVSPYDASVAVVRLFAAAREAAGTGRDELPGDSVADVLRVAIERYGPGFAEVLPTCRIWVNGEAAADDTLVTVADEVAILPPVSGGADDDGEFGVVRRRRQELQADDDALSYVRRVAQARADLTRAEQRRRSDPTADGGDRSDITDDLRDVLADRLLGPSGPGRPPRPAEDFSDDHRARELDERCARLGFGRLDELTGDELAALLGALDEFEVKVSAERHAVHTELDSLTDRLVEGYRDQYAGQLDEDGA